MGAAEGAAAEDNAAEDAAEEDAAEEDATEEDAAENAVAAGLEGIKKGHHDGLCGCQHIVGFSLVDLQASYPIAILIVLGPGLLPQHTHGNQLAQHFLHI